MAGQQNPQPTAAYKKGLRHWLGNLAQLAATIIVVPVVICGIPLLIIFGLPLIGTLIAFVLALFFGPDILPTDPGNYPNTP